MANNEKLKEYNRKLFKEYKQTLKHSVFDETLTLYILRPIAFIFVKLLYPTKVTPNQVSLMSIIVGVFAGFFFSRGDSTSFIFAGLFYMLSLIFDCADGMLARLKKNGTEIGRIIDGLADYLVNVAVYIGLLIGITRNLDLVEYWPYNSLILIILSAVSHILHSMIVDYYRVEFMSHALGMVSNTSNERSIFENELKKMNGIKGKLFEKFLIKIYLGYLKLQILKQHNIEYYNGQKYYENNKFMILLWFWIGPTAHVFVLTIAAIIYRPIFFFFYTIILANTYMLILLIIQRNINKKIVNY